MYVNSDIYGGSRGFGKLEYMRGYEEGFRAGLEAAAKVCAERCAEAKEEHETALDRGDEKAALSWNASHAEAYYTAQELRALIVKHTGEEGKA